MTEHCVKNVSLVAKASICSNQAYPKCTGCDEIMRYVLKKKKKNELSAMLYSFEFARAAISPAPTPLPSVVSVVITP